MGPVEELKLKDLTFKTVMLVHAFTLNGIKHLDNQITFEINTLLKTSKPGKHIKPLVFKAYPVGMLLCVVTSLEQYLLKTSVVRDGNNELWLSFNKPHKPVSKDTIARWIKTVMGKAGIDTSCYAAHSTRSASTSAASSTKLPIDIIMKAAGWSSETTFQRFYNKPIEHSANFWEHLLLSYQDVNK
jgi:integrase